MFSRLTAPTKATIGKSRRTEDKKTREEWRKTINSQIDYDESQMNMGGFVLKEQRYKKTTASRSPISNKYKKRPMTAATTGEVSTSYNVTTTQKIIKSGKNQITSARTVSRDNQNLSSSHFYSGNF